MQILGNYYLNTLKFQSICIVSICMPNVNYFNTAKSHNNFFMPKIISCFLSLEQKHYKMVRN